MLPFRMNIVMATDRKTIAKFVRFPRTLYKGSPYWVPPLWKDEYHAYDRQRNVMLRNNDYQLLLAIDSDNTIVGRSIVYIDASYNSHCNIGIGFFGAFECIEDQHVADALMDASSHWLKEKGMSAIRGPIHPIAESWGFLLNGYESLPVFMAPYNFPYYHEMMESYGMRKIMNLYAYEADMDDGYSIPERIERFTCFFEEKHPEITTRRFDLDNLETEARYIWALSNESLKNNWGYVPVDISVMEDMIRRLKPVLDPNAIWFVEDKGIPVGFALGFPDPNPIIKLINGKLLPFGFIQLLKAKKTSRRYRLFALGVLPAYHGMGLDVLLYKRLSEALKGRLGVLEANYILEDNWNIRNALEKLQLIRTKEYRIYQKEL